MASYYYLIASLPELRADGDMPITYLQKICTIMMITMPQSKAPITPSSR